MEEVRKSMSRLRYHQEVHRLGDNMKMATVGLLVASVFVFTLIGEEAVKPIIWYWAGAMTVLLIINAAIDIRAGMKMRQYDCDHK